MKTKYTFVPCTPAGSPCTDLEAPTEDQAWKNLLKGGAHMPYRTKENFMKAGYTIEKWRVV